MSSLWLKFDQFHLTENMRLINGSGDEEKEFAKFLLRVGNGEEGSTTNDCSSADTLMTIPEKFWSTAKTTAQFCEEIYPQLSSVVT